MVRHEEDGTDKNEYFRPNFFYKDDNMCWFQDKMTKKYVFFVIKYL